MSRSQLTSTVEQNTGGAVAPFVAGKNGVINGGMDIAQRGTSVSIAASTSPYTLDRWQIFVRANQACTVSQQPTSDTTNLPNIRYCVRVQRNSGQTGTQTIYFANTFETINSIPFVGKTITFSFYARAGANYSATSNILISDIETGTGTDQNFSSFTGQVDTTQNNTLTTTWQRFTQTYTVPTTVTQIAPQFWFNPTGTAGAADYFEVTGVQLEIGSVATPFSRAGGTLSGELAACQRYYWRNTAPSSSTQMTPYGSCFSTTVMRTYVPFPVTMRTSPSAVEYSGLQTYDLSAFQTINTLDFNNANTAGALISGNVTSGLTQFRPANIYANASTSYIGFSAEL